MASWKEERDRIVATTLAFVQNVAAAHPALPRLDIIRPRNDPHEAADVIPTTIVSEIAVPARAGVEAPAEAEAPPRPIRDPLFSTPSDREEILRRVAAFKARQSQTIRDREAYYEAVQTRILKSLRNQSGSDPL